MKHKRTFISKNFKFEAAHSLSFHKGVCKNLHGHSYHGKIMISSETLVDGMVMDYGYLKAIIQTTILDVADHKNLNDIFTEKYSYYTTAENLCSFFFLRVEAALKRINSDIMLEFVSLKETDTSEAIVYNKNSSFLNTD